MEVLWLWMLRGWRQDDDDWKRLWMKMDTSPKIHCLRSPTAKKQLNSLMFTKNTHTKKTTDRRATRVFHVFMGKWFSRVIWLIVGWGWGRLWWSSEESERERMCGTVELAHINAKNINKLKLLKCSLPSHLLSHSAVCVFVFISRL